MTSFSYSEFTDSLITQKLTLCQVVDFVCNMDIYDTSSITSEIRAIINCC